MMHKEDVFAGILQELREADEILANDASVIDGDIIYNGNSTQWRKLINSFRLKVLMTLSNHTTVGNINIASEFKNIATNSPLMNSLADNGQLVYLDQQGNRYPQFNAQWSGYYMDDYIYPTYARTSGPTPVHLQRTDQQRKD